MGKPKAKKKTGSILSANGRAIESKVVQIVRKDILEFSKQSPKQVDEFLANLVKDYDAKSDGKMTKPKQGKIIYI